MPQAYRAPMTISRVRLMLMLGPSGGLGRDAGGFTASHILGCVRGEVLLVVGPAIGETLFKVLVDLGAKAAEDVQHQSHHHDVHADVEDEWR
jgi:hypothetical protein